ncbi:MAG: ABC transporter ATP-binding protein [Arenicellales bacterium]
MSIVEVENLTRYFPKPDAPSQRFAAVDHVSFSIEAGEIFGILGPNGAGKTSTLEMIEGLLGIDEGSVRVAGISVAADPVRVKQRIGIQLQESEYFDYLSLAELLGLFGDLYHRRVSVDELLRYVGLEDKKHACTRHLSGGQKQRFSIASALVNDPEVLFLDEPTTGLDPHARRNLWALVREVHGRGKTIVLTTHYMEEAEALCGRVAIMDRAKIIALDTPARLIERHAPERRERVLGGTLEDVFLKLTGRELE